MQGRILWNMPYHNSTHDLLMDTLTVKSSFSQCSRWETFCNSTLQKERKVRFVIFYECILSFEGIFTRITYLSVLPWGTSCFSADISRMSGKTEMALTPRRFSNSAKTSASWKKKATDLLNLAVMLYQYTQPAFRIACQCVCLGCVLQSIYSEK